MGTINATSAAMPGVFAQGTTAHSHGAHDLMPEAPRSGDPRFIDGTTGEINESATIKQQDGPAYGGRDVAKNQNDNDRRQQNYNVTDANFTRFLGVIADPDTGKPQSYAQTMQSYNAAGAIEKLYPEVYQQLVANQNAGRGTVLGGALAILGITKSDGAGGASLAGIDPQAVAQVRGAQLPGLGSLKDYVLDTRDAKGREWNRAHHPGSHWSALTSLTGKGWNWDEAAVFTGDSMTSWAGRVLGTNNQDGDQTGFAADELAGLKYLVLTEQATGKRDILESVIMSHGDTHLPESKLTNPKINKLIGLPDNFRPKTKEDVAMVAGRLRQFALDPATQVDRGEFQKFVDAGSKTRAGQIVNGSGLLQSVQFKAENTNNNDNTNNDDTGTNETAEDTTPTGLGTGQLETSAVGGGDIAPAIPGSPTIDTRPTLANLGIGGPFPVIDPSTNKLNKKLQDQLMTALFEVMMRAEDNPFLEEKDERAAFVDGARKGALFIKDTTAVDPTKVASLKEELGTALADGTLSDEERASLSEKLAEAGMEDVAASVKDGSVTDVELATLREKVDGAASAKLEKDVTAALEDGTLTPEERATIESRLGKEGLDAVEKGIADGTVTKEELETIAAGTEKDVAAKAATPAKPAAPDATKDAKDGAAAATEGATADPATPAAGATDAKAGASADAAKAAGDTKPVTDATPAADATPASDSKPAGDTKPAGESKPAGDTKPAGESKPAAEAKPAEEKSAA